MAKLFELHHQLFEAERHYQALDEAEDIVNGMEKATQLYTPWLDALQSAVKEAVHKASVKVDTINGLIEELPDGDV
jgi:hypothetical protein|tara:strand:- start:6329 stop:6556 length:228 start_codon:yes stop_codon:yes gene_type:complete